MSDAPTRVLAAVGGPAVRPVWRRRAAWAVVVLAAALAAMAVALGIGMRIDDAKITRRLATAAAVVLSVSPLRTGIEFVDSRGMTIRPPDGVLYPGRLQVGQEFLVEYDSDDPTLVRVAGRTAAVGNLQVGGTAGVALLVAVGVGWQLWRTGRDSGRDQGRRQGRGNGGAGPAGGRVRPRRSRPARPAG